MSSTRKRSYSPSIDDIRQFNIKRFRLLDDLNSLSLNQDTDSPHHGSPSSSSPSTTQDAMDVEGPSNVEVIPNIEEYLLMNQSDEDIIESAEAGYLAAGSDDVQAVPQDIGVIDSEFMNWLRLRTREIQRGGRHDIVTGGIKGTNGGLELDYRDMIKEYYYKRNGFAMVLYQNPRELVRRVWERWYFDEFKLRQFDSDLITGHDIDEVDVDVDVDVDADADIDVMNNTKSTETGPKVRNTYGGFYHGVSSDASDEMMDLD